MASDTASQPSPSSTSVASSVTLGLKRGAPLDGPLQPSGSSLPAAEDSATEGGAMTEGGPGTGDAAETKTKKRRTGPGPGPRGVANLNPDQLAKKRANDREAQRAIRERTKIQIEKLECRIQELTSQQPYQELQAALRAKEAVEAENADIKRRLASAMSLIQPLISSSPGQTSASASTSAPASAPAPAAEPPLTSPHQSFLPIHPPNALAPAYNSSTPGSATSPGSAADHHPWQAGPSPEQQAQGKMLNQQRHDLRHNLDLGPERLGLEFLVDQSRAHPSAHDGMNGGRLNYPYSQGPTITSNANSHYQQRVGPGHGGSEAHSTCPKVQPPASTAAPRTAVPHGYPAPEIKNSASSCPLDDILLDFLHARRQDAVSGHPVQELVGPRYPSVSSLLNPSNSKYSHPLSKVVTDILSTFPDLSGLPERVAVLYIMFLIMRWQIAPTRENYERLPRWAAPSPVQLSTEHPAWVDHVPFPCMRERLVTRDYGARSGLFDQFFVPFTRTLSLNWPYEDTDTLLLEPNSKEDIINPVFERHLRRLENWTLGEAFATTFPELEGTYNLTKE